MLMKKDYKFRRDRFPEPLSLSIGTIAAVEEPLLISDPWESRSDMASSRRFSKLSSTATCPNTVAFTAAGGIGMERFWIEEEEEEGRGVGIIGAC